MTDMYLGGRGFSLDSVFVKQNNTYKLVINYNNTAQSNNNVFDCLIQDCVYAPNILQKIIDKKKKNSFKYLTVVATRIPTPPSSKHNHFLHII